MQYTIDIPVEQYMIGPNGEECRPLRIDIIRPLDWYLDQQRHHVVRNETGATIRTAAIICEVVKWRGDPGDLYHYIELSPEPHIAKAVETGDETDAKRHKNRNYFKSARAAASRLKAHVVMMRAEEAEEGIN